MPLTRLIVQPQLAVVAVIVGSRSLARKQCTLHIGHPAYQSAIARPKPRRRTALIRAVHVGGAERGALSRVAERRRFVAAQLHHRTGHAGQAGFKRLFICLGLNARITARRDQRHARAVRTQHWHHVLRVEKPRAVRFIRAQRHVIAGIGAGVQTAQSQHQFGTFLAHAIADLARGLEVQFGHAVGALLIAEHAQYQ